MCTPAGTAGNSIALQRFSQRGRRIRGPPASERRGKNNKGCLADDVARGAHVVAATAAVGPLTLMRGLMTPTLALELKTLLKPVSRLTNSSW